MRAASGAAVLGAALLLAGCGGGSGPASTRAPVPLTPAERRGRVLFVRTCGSCHTLAAAGTHGVAGPSLDTQSWRDVTVTELIETGPGLMPGGLLTGRAVADVAAYVAAVTR